MNKHLAKYGGPPVPLSAELEDAFRRYDWPGNVRQLENVVKRLVVLRDVDLVLSDLASPELPGLADSAEPGGSVFLKEVSAMAAERAEKDLVLRLLEERNWNRKQVARELNICYKSLLNKLHRWQIPAHGRSAAAIAATFAKTMG